MIALVGNIQQAPSRAIVAKSASNTPNTRGEEIASFKCGKPCMQVSMHKKNNFHIGIEEEEEGKLTNKNDDASFDDDALVYDNCCHETSLVSVVKHILATPKVEEGDWRCTTYYRTL